MQYTNNMLDLLVTIGYNIQSTVAYRSTGMDISFFPLRFNAITGSSNVESIIMGLAQMLGSLDT